MGPKERILHAVADLFYREGYEATGINRVLEQADAHKQSLYQHFGSKESLGLAYIEVRTQEISTLLRMLTKIQDPVQMMESWVRILKREAKRGRFQGCPVANLGAQTVNTGAFREKLTESLNEWIAILEDYFRLLAKKGILSGPEPEDLARRTLAIYEGNVQLYMVTGDLRWLDRIASDFRQM